MSNADEYWYGYVGEKDPLPKIKGGDGKIVAVPNLPVQRAKRATDMLEELVARPAAGGMTDEQADALAERLFVKLGEKIGDVVVATLLDPRVQAALIDAATRGANAAEDA